MKMRGLVPVLLMLLVAGCEQSGASPDYDTNEDSAATTPPPPTALVFCPEVGRRLSQEDCDDLTTIAGSARQGVAAFNAPDPMYRGKTVTLQLAVGFAPTPALDATGDANQSTEANAQTPADTGTAPETAPEEATNAVEERNQPAPSRRPPPKPVSPEDVVGQLPGTVVSYQPVVGRYMRATLTGEGFTINARSPEQQEVFTDDQTTWEWDVTATKGDRHVLTLKTVVEGVTADGHHYPLRSTTRNQVINVKLSTLDKVRDWLDGVPGWLKLVTAALTGLAACIAAVWAVVRAVRGQAAAPETGDGGDKDA